MPAAIFPALLCLLLGMLAWIDLRAGIIPDWLNLAIALLGLINVILAAGWLAGLAAFCEGAVIGLLVWLLRRLYFKLRKVQGLGLGDVKFLAAAGIWTGVAGLPMLLLVAAVIALISVGALQVAGRRPMTRQLAIPFGPFLAVGLLVTLAVRV